MDQQGFQLKQEKGLFTFYKQQQIANQLNRLCKKDKHSERRHNLSQNSHQYLRSKSLNKQKDFIYLSLNRKKKQDLGKVNKSCQKSRLKTQENQVPDMKEMKKVVSLNFQYELPRKNAKNQSYNKIVNKHHMSSLHYPMVFHLGAKPKQQYIKIRQNSKSSNEFEAFFKKKHQMSKLNYLNKKQIRINSVACKCIDDQQLYIPLDEPKSDRPTANKNKNKINKHSKSKQLNKLFEKIKQQRQNEKQMSTIQQMKDKDKMRIKNMKYNNSNINFNDLLDQRLKKIQRSKVWLDIKQRNLQKQEKMAIINRNILALLKQGKIFQILQIHQNDNN